MTIVSLVPLEPRPRAGVGFAFQRSKILQAWLATLRTNFEIDNVYYIGRVRETEVHMAFHSQIRGGRSRAAVRPRISLRDAVGALAFFLAIGFSAAVAFGLFGG
jgi:hypothetical protein